MTLHTLLSPGGATEVKQDDILTSLTNLLVELQQKYEGGAIALDAPTLAALEQITATVANWPADYPDAAGQALLAAIDAALQGTLTVDGTVALDAPTLAALETVDADVQNWPVVFPDQHDQPLTDAELRAAPVPVITQEPLTVDGTQLDALTAPELQAVVDAGLDSGEREYTHVVATVTASGDTTVYTPAAGKAIRLHWIYAINDPSSSSPPLINVSLGAVPLYRVYALSKRQRKTGAVDAPLVINLNQTGQVAVTAILEEI